ncbi:esterase/lipase family protein [Rahnella aceris]
MARIHLMADREGTKRNVVLVHGLGGHYRDTWIAGKDKNTFWPNWLQQDDPELRIWSVEYKTSVLARLGHNIGLKDRADNIFELLKLNKVITSGEVIFIGHSQGGLLIKQIIRLASDRANDPQASVLLNSITGVAFLGTPHLGSDLASAGNSLFVRMLIYALSLGGQPSAMTANLYRNNPDLRELNVWYRNWDRTFDGKHLILGESVETAKIAMIVKPDSSDPGFQTEMVLVDTDHGGICKPDTQQHEVYQHVLNFVMAARVTPQNFWLRSHFAGQASGWSGYQNWSGRAPDGDVRYIIDDKVKFTDATLDSQNKINVGDMLTSVRQKLGTPGAVIRLVGLSGVGKTRFVQALFEPEVGVAPLSPERVFYTDTSRSPFPTPIVLLEKLITTGQEAVIVIDNCSSELHKLLLSVLQTATTPVPVSLLTVEYDVREDIPERTEVISMETNSEELIEKLITCHYPSVNQVSCGKIAEFSGGNARVALALASTIGRDENISRLRDSDLFTRLFNQRHDGSQELLKAGTILSLVYSFMFTAEEGESDELADLGRIAQLDHDRLYASASEIRRRGLAQVRGDWMAILPHPVANKLAQMALENFPHSRILSVLNPEDNERLFRSFTRRLGYLSDSEEASDIVSSMLSYNGIFERMLAQGKHRYTETFALISNVAPVAQKQTLEFIERGARLEPAGWFFTRENQSFSVIARLLRSIAYEAQYFEQCVSLLCLFAENEKKGENTNSTTDLLSTLFHINLSGTHAPLSLRIKIINTLLLEQRTSIALRLLGSLLKTSHFTSFQSFDFGAQVRDYGYHPQTWDDYDAWFCKTLDFLIEIYNKRPELSREICDIVKSKFRSLWKVKPAQNQLYTLVNKLIGSPGDEILWCVVREAIRFNSESVSVEERDALLRLELLTRPNSLEKNLNVFIFSNNQGFYGLEQYDEHGNELHLGYEVALEKAAELGREVAKSPHVLKDSIIIRALRDDSDYSRMMGFASALASEVSDPAVFCQKLNTLISQVGAERIRNVFICGALGRIYNRDPELCHAVLDAYLQNPEMDKHFAVIQAHIPMDAKSVERIKRHLQGSQRDVSSYKILSTGRLHAVIPDSSLVELLQLVWRHQNGPSCAFDILSMRIHDDNGNADYSCSEPLLELARKWVIDIISGNPVPARNIPSYAITTVAKRAFRECPIDQTHNLLNAIVKSSSNYMLHEYDFDKILGLICKYQPLVILNRLCSEPGTVDASFRNILSQCTYRKELPLTALPLDITLAWCQQDPQTRYPYIAELINPYEKKEQHYVWTATAIALIEGAPSPEQVLSNLALNFNADPYFAPRDSYSDGKLALLRDLQNSVRSDIAHAAAGVLEVLQKQIDSEQKRATRLFRRKNERFEE